jgi:adenosylmethionine-8-amino-7-oxononanoate aminotransferase
MTSVVTIVYDGNVTLKPTSTSEHNDDNKSAVLHRHLHNPPKRVISAKGNFLTLEDGRKIFDATGGAAVACIGHGNESVKAAVARQMDQVSYCHSLFFSSSGAENLAKALIESTKGVMSKAFIVSSGEYFDRIQQDTIR